LSPSNYIESAIEIGANVPAIGSLMEARRAVRSSDPLAIVAAIRYAAHGGPQGRPWTSNTRDQVMRAGLVNKACPIQITRFAQQYWS
jgi:hypothetical protein